MESPAHDASNALQWFRREICHPEGDTHGLDGELDCLLMRLAEVRASAAPA